MIETQALEFVLNILTLLSLGLCLFLIRQIRELVYAKEETAVVPVMAL